MYVKVYADHYVLRSKYFLNRLLL